MLGTLRIIWFQCFLFLFSSPLLTSLVARKFGQIQQACVNDILGSRESMCLYLEENNTVQRIQHEVLIQSPRLIWGGGGKKGFMGGEGKGTYVTLSTLKI